MSTTETPQEAEIRAEAAEAKLAAIAAHIRGYEVASTAPIRAILGIEGGDPDDYSFTDPAL